MFQLFFITWYGIDASQDDYGMNDYTKSYWQRLAQSDSARFDDMYVEGILLEMGV